MTNIKQVAQKAGVSVATVSRVLSNKPHVRPEVRDHVLQVIQELGYHPSRIAGSMRHQSSQIIGLLISDIRNPFFTAIARAIEDIANTQEMNIFLCNTDEDPAKEKRYLDTLLQERVAGIILSPTLEHIDRVRDVLERGVPLVTIDRRITGANVDSVLSNNVQSAYHLTQHLIAQGYGHPGIIIGLEGSTTGRERFQGCEAALKDAGIKPDRNWLRYTHPREAEGELLVTEWLAAARRPQAILTGNSRLTIGALNAIQKAGLRIPEDIGLAGFDETSWMPHVSGGITVISQPTYEMGKTAAELLFQRIENPDIPTREVILKGTLIERASSVRRREPGQAGLTGDGG